MDEKLQVALAELINKANQGVDGAASFMNAQLPDVVSQLLTWYATKSAIMCLIAVSVVVAWIAVEVAVVKWMRKEECDSEAFVLIYGLIGSLARILPIIMASYAFNLDWLQIWIAPKIWLIEYAASLAK